MEGAGDQTDSISARMVTCIPAPTRTRLWMIDKDKKVTVLVEDFEARTNGPNDLG